MSRAYIRWILLALAASPALFTLCAIVVCGVDLPVMDQWMPDIAGMFIKAHQGHLSFGDFWIQHNEHRILIPRVIFFVLGVLTHWNTIAEMVATWAVVCMTSAGILWLCADSARPRVADQSLWARLDGHVVFIWFLCNLLLFSLGQWENWLSGLGLCNVLPAAFLIAAIVVARMRLSPWPRTFVAIALCWEAMFSSGNGVLAWPLVGLLLAWSGSWDEFRSKKWILAVFFGAFLTSCLVYAIGYQLPPRPLPSDGKPTSLGLTTVLFYNIIFLSNPFCFSSPLPPLVIIIMSGMAVALLLVLSAVYFLYLRLRRKDFELCDRMVVWLAVAGYALGSGIIASFFRAQLGADQAGSSRYVTFSIYAPIALVSLIPMICADLRSRRIRAVAVVEVADSHAAHLWERIPTALATLVILLQVFSLDHDLNAFQAARRIRDRAKGQLLLVNCAIDRKLLIQDVCFDPDTMIAEARTLNEMGYLRPPLISTSNANSLPQEQIKVGDDFGKAEGIGQNNPGEITIVGWAMLPDKSQTAHAVFLTCENENGEPIIFTVAGTGMLRSDISKEHGSAKYLWSGWVATFPVERLPATMTQFKFSAWALNVDTGSVCRIPGEIHVNR